MKIKILFFSVIDFVAGACSNDYEKPAEKPIHLKATAVITAGAVQQNIRVGGVSIRNWIADITSAQRTKAFSVNNGIGLSVLRVRVPFNGADFSAAGSCGNFGIARPASSIATLLS